MLKVLVFVTCIEPVAPEVVIPSTFAVRSPAPEFKLKCDPFVEDSLKIKLPKSIIPLTLKSEKILGLKSHHLM